MSEKYISKCRAYEFFYFYVKTFFLTEVSFQLSACSDRGSFANRHLGEFLTPWISPLDMIVGARGIPLVSDVIIISFRRNAPKIIINKSVGVRVRTAIGRTTCRARSQYTTGPPLKNMIWWCFSAYCTITH